MSRHEEFDPREVRRALAPGGTFITQQVGARNYEEINQRLDAAPAPATNALGSVRDLAKEVSSAGLRVRDQQEVRFEDAFLDVGALVWYLRLAPWQVPGFSVSRSWGDLTGIHHEIRRAGRFVVTAHRLLVIADTG